LGNDRRLKAVIPACDQVRVSGSRLAAGISFDGGGRMAIPVGTFDAQATNQKNQTGRLQLGERTVSGK